MQIGFQLYSARDFAPWADVIEKIARLGYTSVEGFGGVYGDAAAFRALLDRHDLTMPSGHFFPIGHFENTLDATLATATTLGMNRVFCPAPEDTWRNRTDAETWIALAKRLEEACKKVNDAGFAFGWHNHHWEFMPLPGGELAMELILEHAPSVDWEMDVAWVVRGGANPLTWIADHGSRITTAHVKDIARKGENGDEDGWADVGHGTMDWTALMSALKGAGVDLFVAEHDKPSAMSRFAARSIDAIRRL